VKSPGEYNTEAGPSLIRLLYFVGTMIGVLRALERYFRNTMVLDFLNAPAWIWYV